MRSGRNRNAAFIPTRVGNSIVAVVRARRLLVHPHARGEQAYRGTERDYKDGSSPRAWGTGGEGQAVESKDRFIPTRVGNSSPPSRPSGCATVHPHARGEQLCDGGISHRLAGSSPRAWGTAVAGELGASPLRFIPTRVGNSSRHLIWCRGAMVHPHARGEQAFVRGPAGAVYGSSPRAWGTVLRRDPLVLRHRFIPTRVGNSCRSRDGHRPPSVHPHARGEQTGSTTLANPQTGSSPRAWGTGLTKLRAEAFFRFIPTRVGNRSQ